MDAQMIDRIAQEVLRELGMGERFVPPPVSGPLKRADCPAPPPFQPKTGRVPQTQADVSVCMEAGEDITSPRIKALPLLDAPQDPEALERMMRATPARIGVGRAGPRLKTQTLLTLRADHAAARDAVMMDVPQSLLDELGLFSVQTCCTSKDQFLTRPDLGRRFPPEALEEIKKQCRPSPDVQIYASDGLSSAAVQANLANILPVLTDGLRAQGLTVGTPFFVRFGRVAAMDHISEALDAKVTCVLLGERPGLGTAESMSAYLAYRAAVGMPEARRTVVSNIHKNGISAVEAGAYLCDVVEAILKAKTSGVDLRKG